MMMKASFLWCLFVKIATTSACCVHTCPTVCESAVKSMLLNVDIPAEALSVYLNKTCSVWPLTASDMRKFCKKAAIGAAFLDIQLKANAICGNVKVLQDNDCIVIRTT